MRYLIYARKSSESEERQAQSIDDQLRDLRALAGQRNLTVVGELTEARSAKAPGARPVFAELVARLQAGEADAILCWHVNRLFRNPVDFGTISWMLQTGALQEIHTPHQVHRAGDNVLLLSVENGMANQYVLDLRRAVERGTRTRLANGWFPHRAPEGYVNRGATVEPDPERFPVIQRALRDLAAGARTADQVHRDLAAQGYATRQAAKRGGRPISRATVYNIAGNLFYAGYFVRAGETFKGAHVPMITLAEYFRIQARLKAGPKRRRRVHEFPYAGLITCGDCGCQVVGERKRKALADGTAAEYVYYSCSNAKGGCRRTAVRQEAVERQVAAALEAVAVPAKFLAYAEETVAEWRTASERAQREERAAGAAALQAGERRLARLLDLRLDGELTEAEYREQRKRLADDLAARRMERQVAEESEQEAWQVLENAVSLMHYGRDLFAGGSPAVQNRIARTLGASYVLTQGRLAVELNPVFSRFLELKKSPETGSPRPETGIPPLDGPTWWATLDAIRTAIVATKATIPALTELLRPGEGDDLKPSPTA